MDIQRVIIEDIPSQRSELLSVIKQSILTDIIRYSWWSPEKAMHELNIPADSVFRRTSGPLVLKLASGLSIGVASLPEKASVTLWLEEADTTSYSIKGSLMSEPELFAIDVSDKAYGDAYILKTIGRRVVSMTLLQRAAENSKLAMLPREAGLVLVFENGIKFILAHGLHNNSDDFAVIFEQEIAPQLREQMTATEI